MVRQEKTFPEDVEALLATAARILAARGAATEVALLATGHAKVDYDSHDNWDDGTHSWNLRIEIQARLYARMDAVDREGSEISILDCIRAAMRTPGHWIRGCTIGPEQKHDPEWRDKAKAWLAGEGVSNQGRVRSDNIAARGCDGLLFRSQPEINLYKALKSRGVSFAPLPVFVRGGQEYRRIEPDFILIKDGVMLAVEVDGDTVHQETPVEAHARTTMLVHEGVHLERVPASHCETDAGAAQVAERVIALMSKHATNK